MEKVTIDKERYDDLVLMEQFIVDNGLVFQYEMFLDVLYQMEQANDVINPKTIDLDERGN